MKYYFITDYEVLDILQLQQYLRNYSGRLTTIIEGCVFDSGIKKLTIHTTEELTENEITAINTLLVTYSNPPIPNMTRIRNLGLQKSNVQTRTWQTIFYDAYKPELLWTLKKIHILGFFSPSLDCMQPSYSVRLVDTNLNTVIGESSCNDINQHENIIEINNINISDEEDHMFEIQCKVNDLGIAVILSAHYVLEQQAS